jgi:hypothetical protein
MIILKLTAVQFKKWVPDDWACDETCRNFSNRRQVPGTPQSEKSENQNYN